MDAYLTPASPDLDRAAMDTAEAWISSQREGQGFQVGRGTGGERVLATGNRANSSLIKTD